MTPFPDRPERPRVAVFSGFAFPVADEAWLYAGLERLASGLGAESVVGHTVVPDPRPLAAELRRRLGTGLFVPQNPDMHANDVAHFRRTLPARCDSLVAVLAAHAPTGAAEVLARREVQEAIGCARWVRAWGADLVVSCGLAEGSLQAFVTAHLLDLPRVVVLTATEVATGYGPLLPLHVAQARVVVAVGAHVRDGLVARCGEAVLARTVVAAAGDLHAPAVHAAFAAALAVPRAQHAPLRGPAVAFTTSPGAPPPSPGVRPFLVLGAERTGSNMLVGMLQGRPGFACAGELFNPRSIAAGELGWLAGAGEAAAPAAAELLQLRRDDPAALLARLRRDGAAAGARHVGCKLLYGHGIVDDRVVDAFVGDRDLAVVHLLREDRLQRWLSLARARASDRWFAAPGVALPVGEAPIALDVQATATEFALGELLEARHRALFWRHAVLELDYEDLAQRLPASAQRLGTFFGVDLGRMVPRSQKTGSRDLERAIANLDELRSAFAGTRWAGLVP